jgi:hypothetical protein
MSLGMETKWNKRTKEKESRCGLYSGEGWDEK